MMAQGIDGEIVQHDCRGAQRAKAKEEQGQTVLVRRAARVAPRLRNMSAARSGNAGPATRLIQPPISTMGWLISAWAASTKAAVSAIVSRTATATATHAQAATRWLVPGAVPRIPTIASSHGPDDCVMSQSG